MVKSGLVKNILKFHEPLQRYLISYQANSAFLVLEYVSFEYFKTHFNYFNMFRNLRNVLNLEHFGNFKDWHVVSGFSFTSGRRCLWVLFDKIKLIFYTQIKNSTTHLNLSTSFPNRVSVRSYVRKYLVTMLSHLPLKLYISFTAISLKYEGN